MNDYSSNPKTEVLAVDDCWKYLESSYIGRLAVIHGSEPEIFPVNFIVLKRKLVFRTATGTKLRALLTGNPVALEADGLNTYSSEVWSVVVKGIPVPFEGDDADFAGVDPDRSPWEPGLKEHLICVDPREISGRRFAVRSRTRWWPPQDFSADWL